MTPQTAQRTAQHARRLLSAHILTPHDYAVFDALLWRCRRPGHADLIVTYAAVARLAGVCRDTAINAVRKLAEIGLIQKIRRRVTLRWGERRSLLASRQAANAYVFQAAGTESAPTAPDKGISRFKRFTGGAVAPVRTVAEQIEALSLGCAGHRAPIPR